MKKYIFLLITLISISNLSFGQDREFKLTKEGLTDFIVTPVENKTVAEMYTKTLNWVNKTFKNPKEVILAQLENDYIRIEGSNNSLICTTTLGKKTCNLAKFQIEISFKDGKYKFDVLEISQYSTLANNWVNSTFGAKDVSYIFNKKGEIKSNYVDFVHIPEYFNILNTDLKNSILGIKSTTESNW